MGCSGYEAGKLLRTLRDKAEQWWYFLDHPEVPPDNNQAERSLRLAVTKRNGARGVSFNGAVCSNGRFTQCSADLSPTGTVGKRVFQTSLDGKVSEWDIPTISVAPTDHLNPYVKLLQMLNNTSVTIPYIGLFEFVYNAPKEGKALLSAFLEYLLTYIAGIHIERPINTNLLTGYYGQT